MTVFLVAAFALAILAQRPLADAQMSLGSVTAITGPQACPAGRNFIPQVGNNCYQATLNCSNNDPLPFWYGIAAPSGTPKGTIVHFTGDGGGSASDGLSQSLLLESFVANEYQVVQIAWGQAAAVDWEYTNVSGGSNPSSILNAACRPATFLNWVRNGAYPNVGQGIWGRNGGMCAWGHSAGSGALAYALAWYNAGAASASTWGYGYLDKALFTSGPVFSNIAQGCHVGSNGLNGQYTLICVDTGQAGCVGWRLGQDPPGASLEYTNGYKSEVNNWSGATGPACANNMPNQATTYDSQWFQMSVLYNGGTQQPSFNYTNTAISAWLCETVNPGVQVNNAASQGQLYWAQFTSTSQAGNSLSVNAVTGCPSTEDVLDGTVAETGRLGSVDILTDMTSGTTSCSQRHGSQ